MRKRVSLELNVFKEASEQGLIPIRGTVEKMIDDKLPQIPCGIMGIEEAPSDSPDLQESL